MFELPESFNQGRQKLDRFYAERGQFVLYFPVLDSRRVFSAVYVNFRKKFASLMRSLSPDCSSPRVNVTAYLATVGK